MKKSKTEKITLANDSLLGGAAMSLSDLAMIESQEIQWSFIRQETQYLDTSSISN